MLTAQLSEGRGCGSRKSGKLYLCTGLSPSGVEIDTLVIDPAIPFEGEFKRGYSLVEDKNGIYHVFIFVGKSFYPSPWHFVEEVRRGGVSRNVGNNFPIDKLTPGASRMLFVHSKAIPLFDYETATKWYPYCRHQPEQDRPGWHNLLNITSPSPYGSPCAHALRDLSTLEEVPHKWEDDQIGQPIKVTRPSIAYTLNPPVKVSGTSFYDLNSAMVRGLEWGVGIFLATLVTHVEAKDYLPQGPSERVYKAGFNLEVLSY